MSGGPFCFGFCPRGGPKRSLARALGKPGKRGFPAGAPRSGQNCLASSARVGSKLMPLAVKAVPNRATACSPGRSRPKDPNGRIGAEHRSRKAEARGGFDKARAKLILVPDISAQVGIRHANRAVGHAQSGQVFVGFRLRLLPSLSSIGLNSQNQAGPLSTSARLQIHSPPPWPVRNTAIISQIGARRDRAQQVGMISLFVIYGCAQSVIRLSWCAI
jgi:hypothetical protein